MDEGLVCLAREKISNTRFKGVTLIIGKLYAGKATPCHATPRLEHEDVESGSRYAGSPRKLAYRRLSDPTPK